MQRIIQLMLTIVIIIVFVMCDSQTKENSDISEQETSSMELAKPSDADFLAFMVYHHMNYMKTTAKQAGGTNKLLHTKKLPTEGTDPVVTPALDHLYSKAVIDLTEGPVTLEFPKKKIPA